MNELTGTVTQLTVEIKTRMKEVEILKSARRQIASLIDGHPYGRAKRTIRRLKAALDSKPEQESKTKRKPMSAAARAHLSVVRKKWWKKHKARARAKAAGTGEG